MGMSSSTQKDDQLTTTTTTTTKKQIFILSGQSNMASRGGVKNKHWDGIDPRDCKPDPSIINRLNANLIWETAQETLHTDIDTKKIYGWPAVSEIKSMLWHQGEIDTSSDSVAESYKSNMEILIHNIRSDLGLPSLPIIQVNY
ncbi:hypothetical protein L6452_35786 [Arctium lappa]|uniref:Uncharacterized protein n=1 Tax=Arctium lappa TaxID=4217 RepID=A0ACB8Y6R9_ARCLA|nr:hypothetical protein L6452_35786 [Arctium lappa]